MNVLEFIRRNSILVIIVIGIVGLGLLLMDYSGRGSAFSRDFLFQVNGTRYTSQDAHASGEMAVHVVQSLQREAYEKLVQRFDTDGNEKLEGAELVAADEWVKSNPAYSESGELLATTLQVWGHGFSQKGEINIAVNRAVLNALSQKLGIYPSKDQVDNYLRRMPCFTKADGSFDADFYRRLTGHNAGMSSSSTERSVREVVADLIVWESLQQLMLGDLGQTPTAAKVQAESLAQRISGTCATLERSSLPTPAEPTEEEVKTYWEAHKGDFKSKERRMFTVFTLTPGSEDMLNELSGAVDNVMSLLNQSGGSGFEEILQEASENAEAPFSFRTADGKAGASYELTTLEDAPEGLKLQVRDKNTTKSLAEIAFADTSEAPTPAALEELRKSGREDASRKTRQYSEPLATLDNKIVIVRADAIEPAAELPYEEAKTGALAALKAEREANALADAAKKMYEAVEAALPDGVAAAFEKAKEAGATVQEFGPAGLLTGETVPSGVNIATLLPVPTGKLAPLAVNNETGTATVVAVTGREITEDLETRMIEGMLRERSDATLRGQLLVDWLQSCYETLELGFSKDASLN